MKIGFPLLVVAMLLSTTLVRADFNVTVGATYTYDTIASQWDLKIGANAGQGTGFSEDGKAYTVGTQILVEVTSASPTSVGYDYTIGSDTYSGTATGLDMLGLVFLMFYPLLFAGGTFIWNQTEVEMGPEILLWAFLDKDVASEFFWELSNETYVTSAFTDTEWTFNTIGGNFDNASAVAVFDWVLNAQYVVTADNTDFGGNFRIKMAFDKATGVVKGFKMDMDYSGTVLGSVLDVSMLIHYEQVGYDLGAFFFGAGGFIPGFEWFIAIPALALLGGIAVIIRKRK
ncbi:MAG: hypothetical protein FK730_05725 [Asgard group archaeon]|nr:hypothetical protein [Asgard group archaeon]